MYVQKRPAAVTDLLMERIRAGYAAEVTAEDKSELDSAYAEFRRELEAKRVSRDDMERVRDAVKIGREVGREEVHELTRVFREAARNAGTRDRGHGTRPDTATPALEATPVP
jgi:hypothetical protein